MKHAISAATKDAWLLLGQGVHWLDSQIDKAPLYRFLTKIAALGFIGALVSYCYERPDRRMQLESTAWAILQADRGSLGDHGRSRALVILTRNRENLQGIMLERFQSTGLNLANPQMRQATLSAAVLHRAKIRGGTFAMACAQDVRLTMARLRQVSFVGLYAPRSTFTSAAITATTFSRADLSASDFSRSNIRDAGFQAALLMTSTFDSARIASSDFSGARGDSASFAGAHIINSRFVGSQLPNTDFSGSDLRGSVFYWATLTNADLSNTGLRGVDLTGADLSGAHLPQRFRWSGIASLRSANLWDIHGIDEATLMWAVDTMGAVVLSWQPAFVAVRAQLKYQIIPQAAAPNEMATLCNANADTPLQTTGIGESEK